MKKTKKKTHPAPTITNKPPDHYGSALHSKVRLKYAALLTVILIMENNKTFFKALNKKTLSNTQIEKS